MHDAMFFQKYGICGKKCSDCTYPDIVYLNKTKIANHTFFRGPEKLSVFINQVIVFPLVFQEVGFQSIHQLKGTLNNLGI